MFTRKSADAAEILHSYDLDGRSIKDNKVHAGKEFGKGLIEQERNKFRNGVQC